MYTSNEKEDFVERFRNIRPKQIKEIQLLDSETDTLFEHQPKYVRFAKIVSTNDSIYDEVAFIDMDNRQINACKNGFFIPLRMVIPRNFHLVDIKKLYDSELKANDLDSCVQSVKKFLSETAPTESIILDVCLNVDKTEKEKIEIKSLPFHACDNKNADKLFLDKNGNVCHYLAMTMDSSENGEIFYKLILFYACLKQIEDRDDELKEPRKVGPVVRRHLKPASGYFFIPILRSDQAIGYFGFPNLPTTPGQKNGVKHTLLKWIKKAPGLQKEKQGAVVATLDAEMPPIDEWGVSISCKSVLPESDEDNQPSPKTGEK